MTTTATKRAGVATRSSMQYVFLSVAVVFVSIALYLVFTAPDPTADHPCPYADALGLEKRTPIAGEQVNSAVPAGHVDVAGLREEDCPHLMIAKMRAKKTRQ